MANDWNNVKPVGCKHWLVLPAVYSDALSYGDQIAQFCSALNKMIQNNNNLPAYVQEMIQEYISGGVIGEIVQEVIAEFILNVKYPPEGLTPATGDGTVDDTEAIQGCIDYAQEHNGMAVYLPSGDYSVQSLTLKSEVSLFGFDRYSTKLVLRGGATNPLITLNGSDIGIYNLTLDGNAGVQVENVNVISMIAKDVLLDNLILQNGYQLLVYNGTGGHLQINDVVFGNAVYRAVGISGNSVVQAKGVKFNQLSAVSGVDVINIASDGGTYDFISDVPCETCLNISGNDNYVTGIENGATNAFVDIGLRNTIDFKGNEKKEYYYGSTDSTVEGNVGFTANGAYSENVSGAFTSVRKSTESKIVTGASTEQYNTSQSENVAGKKTITAQDIQLNPVNPLQYKTPEVLNRYFKTIPFKDSDNNEYKVLVENEFTGRLDTSIVNVDNFGAVGDGVTDDTDAISNAINFANTNGYSLQFSAGKTYLMRYANISTNCSIDFNGCTIKVSTNNPVDVRALFNVQSNGTNTTITETGLGRYAISNSALYNKVFEIVSPLLLGTRSGENVYFTQLMITDGNGNFINTDYKASIIEGTYTINNVHEVGARLEFKNVTVDYGANAAFIGRLLEINRSNVCVNGVTIKGGLVNTADIFATEVILLTACAYVSINNVIGANPVVGNSSGYVLGIYNVSNLEINGCSFYNNSNTTTWGSIGVSFVTNLSIKNTITNRLDVHYGKYGYYTCDGVVCQYCRVSTFYDTTRFDNCKFINYQRNYSVVDVRQDYPINIGGNFIFSQCVFYVPNAGDVIRFSITDGAIDISNLNLNELSVSIIDCKITEDSPIRHLISVNVPEGQIVSCRVNLKNLRKINTTNQAGLIYGETLINTVLVENILNKGRVIDGIVDTATITNSTLGSNPVRNVDSSTITNMRYINCIINSIESTIYYPNFIMIGCALNNDINPTINSKNYVVNGNMLTGSTKNNLEKWNNRIG